MKRIELYDFIEFKYKAKMQIFGEFFDGEKTKVINGFKISDKEYVVRFMPDKVGEWEYRIFGGIKDSGSFECVKNSGNNHGRVITKELTFCYEDGSKYFPVGTTCYAWVNQSEELINETIKSLSEAPFNKIRMCVFPKSMPYNNNEPEFFPFCKDGQGNWDVSKPEFRFWDRLDKCLSALRNLNIEADLILFHPYDKWGFARMNLQSNLAYLDYCISRLSCYRNIWWSIANEYDTVIAKTMKDWDAFGDKLLKNDPYRHLTSIHHCFVLYPERDWMTHLSIQSRNERKIPLWKKEYNLPVIFDEFGYEGDIEFEWGNLSAFEVINKAWTVSVLCGYVSHGETFHRDNEVLWWAKGGKLYGQSPARFKFLKDLIYEIGVMQPYGTHPNHNPNGAVENPETYKIYNDCMNSLSEIDRHEVHLNETILMSHNEDYRLRYLARTCSAFVHEVLPMNGKYKVEVLDVWEMTRKKVLDDVNGKVKIPLPAKEGIAILISRKEGEKL